MKEYAHILHALADGKRIDYAENGYQWGEVGAETALDLIARKVPPLYLQARRATININGFEVPEPMREAPRAGDRVWVPALLGPEKITDDFVYSTNSDYGRTYFSRGLCHSTKEAAELHAKALLSFTAKP